MKKRWTLVWLVLTFLISGTIIWASLKFSKYDQAIRYIDSKPSQKVIEKQPIYTTILGQAIPGPKGENSVSTHTVTEKETTVIKEVPIQGENGTNGNDGREIELAILDGVLMYRYTGDRSWYEIPILGGEDD